METNTYGKKKKFGVGKIILIIVLLLIGYGAYWIYGAFSMPEDLKNTNLPISTQMDVQYNEMFVNKNSTPLDETESRYMLRKLYNETDFFNFAKSSLVQINNLNMYPKGDNLALEMAVSVGKSSGANAKIFENGGRLASLLSFTTDCYAAETSATLDGNFGISAELQIKKLPQGFGMKPVKVRFGGSEISIAVAVRMAKKYAPAIEFTQDGYIVMKPITVNDKKTGKTLCVINSMEIKDSKLILDVK